MQRRGGVVPRAIALTACYGGPCSGTAVEVQRLTLTVHTREDPPIGEGSAVAT